MPPPPVEEEVKLTNAENEQSDHPYSVAVASAAAADAAVAAAQAATDVVRLTEVTRFAGKSSEEVAAIKIQTAFRGYMVRVNVKYKLNVNVSLLYKLFGSIQAKC